MTLSLPRANVVSPEGLDAAGVQANFEALASAASALTASGTVALPAGLIFPFGGSTAPVGYLLCAGTLLTRINYPSLFAVIGTTYNTGGETSAQFRLPDLRGRVVAGVDNMGGSAASRLTNSGTGNPGINGATLGAAGGVDRHTLTTAQMPSHTHGVYWALVGGGLNAAGTGNAVNNAGTIPTTATGSDQAHPNAQPTIVLNYIIKT